MRVNGGGGLPAYTGESAAVLNGSGQVWNATRKILTVVTPLITVGSGGGVAAIVEPSGATFPAPARQTVYEAEDALRSGVTIASQHAGYTGSGYVDYTNAAVDFVEWTVTVPTAGAYPLGIRYANGGTTDRPLRITVNDTVVAASLSFPPTGGWKTWRTVLLNATLPAGSAVRIRATSTGASGANLDSLSVG
ncbi:CBM35 domain-containing protein [Paractinoplanes bogorensis]